MDILKIIEDDENKENKKIAYINMDEISAMIFEDSILIVLKNGLQISFLMNKIETLKVLFERDFSYVIN